MHSTHRSKSERPSLSSRARGRLWAVCVGPWLFAAIGCGSAEGDLHTASQPLLGLEGGIDGLDLSGLVIITHRSHTTSCSGVLIAPSLVLTAEHCVLTATSDGSRPVEPEGLVVGFGPDPSNLETRPVERFDRVARAEPSDAGSVFIEPGRDVTLLHLSIPAPKMASPHDVDLAFSPVDKLAVQVAGRGLADLNGQTGVIGAASGVIAGFEPASAVILVQGPQTCFGDSGGPVLSADSGAVVGIVGQIGASQDVAFCTDGKSFAATTANDQVRRLIAKACANEGGCGPARGSSWEAGAADATDHSDVATETRTPRLGEADPPNPAVQNEDASPSRDALVANEHAASGVQSDGQPSCSVRPGRAHTGQRGLVFIVIAAIVFANRRFAALAARLTVRPECGQAKTSWPRLFSLLTRNTLRLLQP